MVEDDWTTELLRKQNADLVLQGRIPAREYYEAPTKERKHSPLAVALVCFGILLMFVGLLLKAPADAKMLDPSIVDLEELIDNRERSVAGENLYLFGLMLVLGGTGLLLARLID